jgi:precorrin-2 dehydrogenase/sirohydrochlorin ferrochelatase
MKYYPISLDITNRKCIVVGGGEVAERKIQRLLDSGADVSVISEELTSDLKLLVEERKIKFVEASYDRSHLDGAFLVFGTTDDGTVNEKVFRDARERGILVNVADDPKRCDFILPSLLEQGDLQISVSTGGKSPALARKLRTDLEAMYGPEYAVYLKILGDLRKKIISGGKSSEENKKVFEAIINSDIFEKIRMNQWDNVKALIRKLTGEDLDINRYQ